MITTQPHSIGPSEWWYSIGAKCCTLLHAQTGVYVLCQLYLTRVARARALSLAVVLSLARSCSLFAQTQDLMRQSMA